MNIICELEFEIKKQFYTSHRKCFVKPIKRIWLSMIKYIFKHTDVKLLALQSTKINNNKNI
jgi:hypothetical protein